MKSINLECNNTNLISMFTGEQIYDDANVFMRELLQNAYDACYTRQKLEWSWGTEFLEMEQAAMLNSVRQNYLPRVVISYNSSNGMLFVEDNGIGINEQDLQKYVAQMGACYYTSEEFKMQKLDYEPVSEFGIGLCSCFRVSRAILIESRKAKAINTAWNVISKQPLEPIAAKWFQGADHIEYIQSNRKLIGTRVTVALLPKYAEGLDLDSIIQCVKHYMVSQPIPIDIYFDKQKYTLHRPNMKSVPFSYVAGMTTLVVDNEWLEGYLIIYNEQHKYLVGKSELFQQGFRITEDADGLNLKPEWLRYLSFCLNIKKKMVHLTLARNGILRDEKYLQLREMIGQLIVNYFSKNPLGLSQYLHHGNVNIISPYETEMKLLGQAVCVRTYLKEQEVELSTETILNGYMGRSVKMAYMSKGLFEFFKSTYPKEWKGFLGRYDIIIFEKNRERFSQLIAPYLLNQKYVVTELPGIVYVELRIEIAERKQVSPYRKRFQLYPTPRVEQKIFCFVSNEQTGAFKIVFNENHRNVRLLRQHAEHPKICYLEAVLAENIKQRMINTQNHWHRIIDFGGEFVDTWNSDKPMTVQSIWCLEQDFADSVNNYIKNKFSKDEFQSLGLERLVFRKEDFIDWWYPPK